MKFDKNVLTILEQAQQGAEKYLSVVSGFLLQVDAKPSHMS